MYGLARLRLIIIKCPKSNLSKKSFRTLWQYYGRKKDYINAARYLEEFQLYFPNDTFAVKALTFAAFLQEEKVNNYNEAIKIHQKIISEYTKSIYKKESEKLIEYIKYKAVLKSNYIGLIKWEFREFLYSFLNKIRIPLQITEQIYNSLYRIIIFSIIIGLSFILYTNKNRSKTKQFWSRSDTSIIIYNLLIIFLFTIYYFLSVNILNKNVLNNLKIIYIVINSILATFLFMWTYKNFKNFFYVNLKLIAQTLKIFFFGIFAVLILSIPLIIPYIISIEKTCYGNITPEVFYSFPLKNLTTYAILRVTIFSPISEELIFRGLFYTSLRSKVGIFYAIILSSLFFSLTHEFTSLSFFYFLGSGIIFAIIFEKTKSLSTTITAHIIQNTITTLIHI